MGITYDDKTNDVLYPGHIFTWNDENKTAKVQYSKVSTYTWDFEYVDMRQTSTSKECASIEAG